MTDAVTTGASSVHLARATAGLANGRNEVAGIARLWKAVSAVSVGSLLLAACVSAPASAAKVTITLYNGQHVQTTDSLVTAFEKANPSINVDVGSDDEDTFDAEIVQEGSRSPADVFYTENSPALEYLQQKGLLAKVDTSTLADTPSTYNSPTGDWVGVSARVSVLIYNPSLIKKSQLPHQRAAACEPEVRREARLRCGRDRLSANRDLSDSGVRQEARTEMA